MPFSKLDPGKVDKILELARRGYDVTTIASTVPCSEGSVQKYLRLNNIQPVWSSRPIVEPEQRPTESHTEESHQDIGGEPSPKGMAPRPPRVRAESVTELSGIADTVSNGARTAAGLDFLRTVVGRQDSVLDDMLKYESLVGRKISPYETALGERSRETRDLREQLSQSELVRIQMQGQIQMQEMRNQIELLRMETQNSVARARLEAELGARDSWISKARFVEETGLHYGMGDGQLRREIQGIAHVLGVKAGGLVDGHGQTIPAPQERERKVMSIHTPDEGRKWAEELTLLTGKDLHDEALSRHAQELAMQLFEAKRHIAELEETQHRKTEPTPPSDVPHERKVVLATKGEAPA